MIKVIKLALQSRPEGEGPEEWEWPEYPERLYHVTLTRNVETIMLDGLKPGVSEQQREIWPEAKPYTHAVDNPDYLHVFEDYFYQRNEPHSVLSVPSHYFKYWMGIPDKSWGALEDGSGREQFTWYTDQHIPPDDIQVHQHDF